MAQIATGWRTPRPTLMLFFVGAVTFALSTHGEAWGEVDGTPLSAENSGALYNDPVFTPNHLTTAFHMTPVIFHGGDILRPGEFDFDFALGTFGTDFRKAEKRILLDEDSGTSVYSDLGWRFGLAETIGPLQLPTEIYTQLPFFFSSGGLDSSLLDANGVFQPVRDVDEDFALGKWIWGLRLGLAPETVWRPRVVLGGSVGLPVDDSIASDSTDFDLRLTLEKHLGRASVGTLYTGFLFPGEGKSVLTDLGVDEVASVPYVGVLTEANLAQLGGKTDPGRVWIHFGGSWRDALYDFGALGPDYAEEEMKVTAGLTFDLGWLGCAVGRPRGMLGLSYNLYGGPEEGEAELVARLHFPFQFGKQWPCDGS